MSLEHESPDTKTLRSASGFVGGRYIRITVTRYLKEGTYEVTVYTTDDQRKGVHKFTSYVFKPLGDASRAYHDLVVEYRLREETV